MRSSLIQKLWIIIAFAIAMGFLEAIVVVYVRELYYPEGFRFPLKLLPPKIFNIELIRELTTLIMLASIGMLAGKTKTGKFAWFLLTFGIWDISYYAALKIFLGWPASLLTWDILFLIPVTWIGPVLAPVICSLTMILFGLLVINPGDENQYVKPNRLSWGLTMLGALIIFTSFILEYTCLMVSEGYFMKGGPSLFDPGFIEAVTSYIPGKFKWGLFITGEILIILSLIPMIYQAKNLRILNYK
ncbi:MAG: hypothetical protein DRI73_07010 [Bacteroidetes bacterium]|nr:MAG: hypothetical protein DRI73_07010 [Bacteroidota bacterium]